MCGRYSLGDPSPLKRRFGLEEFAETAITPRFNVAPSQQIPIIVDDAKGRRIVMAKWGFKPGWMKDGKRPPPINARAETLAKSNLYRSALTKARCIIPADGFYEWKAIAGQKVKQPMYMRVNDGELFGFAGIYTWGDEPTAAIITTTPNELIEPIHNRMPAILLPAHEEVWLDRGLTDLDELVSMLGSYPSDVMTATPVSSAVNSASSDEPALIEPIGTD